GLVTGVATPVHRGRSPATYEIVITDEQDRRVCTARLTCMLREVAVDEALANLPEGGSAR
ncbi:thioesterase, partial [Streptomyces sp. 2MCAF27]